VTRVGLFLYEAQQKAQDAALEQDAQAEQEAAERRELELEKLRLRSIEVQREAHQMVKEGHCRRAMSILKAFQESLANSELDAGRVAVIDNQIQYAVERYTRLKARMHTESGDAGEAQETPSREEGWHGHRHGGSEFRHVFSRLFAHMGQSAAHRRLLSEGRQARDG
jgi:hypothetical protein